MSEEDLEVVRRSFDSHAWDRADWDTLKELYDEDVVFHSSIVDIVGKTVVGHEALRRFMTEIQEEWTALRWELEEIFEAPRGIVTFHRVVGIGRTTGLEVTKAVTGLFEVRDGRIVREWVYADRAEALEAAGLSE
jgi:ketosteroid isomerase-like protein